MNKVKEWLKNWINKGKESPAKKWLESWVNKG